jgi:hypothetical protein
MGVRANNLVPINKHTPAVHHEIITRNTKTNSENK